MQKSNYILPKFIHNYEMPEAIFFYLAPIYAVATLRSINLYNSLI